MFNTGQELQNLHDIHLPPAIGWWPIAIGWYILVGCIIIASGLIFIACKNYDKRNKGKRIALATLNSYQQEYLKNQDSQLGAARISELLKQVALIYYPRHQVAGLEGQDWINFLQETIKKEDVQQIQYLLLKTPYQPANKDDITPLFKLARKWIQQRRGQCSL